MLDQINKDKAGGESFGPSQSLRNKPFTIIPNELLQLKGVSLGFRALMPYLLSLPHDWVVYNSNLANFLMVGRDKMQAIVKEAIQLGYMKRTPKKNADGRFVGWHTEYSDCPEFLGSDGLPENPSVGNFDSRKNRHYKINNLTKETNYKNNNRENVIKSPNKEKRLHVEQKPVVQPEPQLELKTKPNQETQEPNGSVVVNCEIDDLIKMVKGWAISRVMLENWAKQHGVGYVFQKIELTNSAISLKRVKRPGAYLNKAIELDWLPPAPHEDKEAKNIPVEPAYPTHEENVTWYDKLAENEKLTVLSEAVRKNPYLEGHLKNANISVLDADFSGTTWFKMMMSNMGRAK